MMIRINEPSVTVIAPKKGFVTLDLREILRYRDLLYLLIQRDIKLRYRQTVIGIAWAVLQPVLTMVVFTIIFGRWVKLPSGGYPYPLYVFAALLPWTFFSNAISACGNSVVGSSNLITKVYFPRLIIPIASIGAGVVDFVVTTIVMLLMMLRYGLSWHWGLLAVPLLFLVVFFTAMGIGTFLSALTVSYRDFRYVTPFVLQLWMYATPIVYSPQLFPARWRWVLNLNPMAGLIDGFRSAFLGKSFDTSAFLISSTVAVVIFVAGIGYFKQVERKFADII